MSAELLNIVESLRRIGLTKVCVVVVLTIAALVASGDWLSNRWPTLNLLWGGKALAPTILLLSLSWIIVSVVESIISAVRKARAVSRAKADAEDAAKVERERIVAVAAAQKSEWRALLADLSDDELYVLRDCVTNSSAHLDWTTLRSADRVHSAVASLKARNVVLHYSVSQFIPAALFQLLVQHPELVGAKVKPRKVLSGD